MLGLFLPNHLQWIQIPIHSAADCETIFPGYITENMVCAGSAGHATCNGDSGGPLVCPDANGVGKLTGIVSFGYTGCTNAGVYAKVHKVVNTISSVTVYPPPLPLLPRCRSLKTGLWRDGSTRWDSCWTVSSDRADRDKFKYKIKYKLAPP